MGEIRPSTWSELHEALFAGMWHEELGLHRSDFAFRGGPEASASLETRLAQLGPDPAAVERHLLRNFRKYAARDAVPVDSPWDWLALGRHHGLPTRLLDWTYSPYVALHFATHDLLRYDRDGVVWMVDYVRAHELLPDALRNVVRDEGANVFTTEMLRRAAETVDAFEALADEPFLLFVEPPSFDERIVNQYALFSLPSTPSLGFESWAAEHAELVRRVVVPAELKWEVRDKLDQANLTERVLFPGLDGLSAWLARHYTPRR